MIELGEISIKDKTVIVEARRKVHILAEILGFDPIKAARLAAAVSEFSRGMAATGRAFGIRVALEERGGALGLLLVFASEQGDAVGVAGLDAVFDHVEESETEDGLGAVGAFKFLPDPEFEPSVEIIGRARGIVQRLTREELYARLQEAHDGLEMRVEKRTAELQKAKELLELEIEERKQIEEELRESEENYRLLLKNLPSIVYRGFEDWSVDFIDNKIELLTGYSMEEFNSRKVRWSDLIVEENMDATKQTIRKALETDRSFVREYRIKTKTGDILWIQDRGQIICNEKGEIEHVSGVFFDITEHKLAGIRLEKEFGAITAVVSDMLSGEVDDAQTEKRVLDACLTATDSVYGMIGVINEHGQYDTTVYSSKTLQDCAFPEALAWEVSTGMPIRGIWGWPMLHGEPLLCNDLQAHPDRVGAPEGHVPIRCFLGVPIKRDREVVGMVAVANKPGGYTEEDRDTLVRLASVMTVSREHRLALKAAKITSVELERLVARRTEQLEREIKERRQAEEELRESEERHRDLYIESKKQEELYQSLLNQTPDAVVIYDLEGGAKYVNPAFKDLYGYTLEEIYGKRIDFVPVEEEERTRESIAAVVAGDAVSWFETTRYTKDRLPVDVAISSARFYDHTGLPAGIVVIHRDITERRQAEETLAAERERLAVTLKSIGDGVIATDTDSRITLMNSLAEQLTGWSQEDAKGKPLDSVFHIFDESTSARYEARIENVLKDGVVIESDKDVVLVANDGSERSISYSCTPIHAPDSEILGAVLVFRDVTEKRKLEAEVRKSDKLESLGILAGGIGHDFNNMLTAILGNVMIAKEVIHENDDEMALSALDRAENAGMRAADLALQLLTFSKGGAPIKRAASIVGIIKDTSRFVLSGSKVACDFDLPDDLWPVDIDTGQMSQVFSNLFLNANQAMDEGGRINVKAGNVTLSGDHPLPLKDGMFVTISFQDNGPGIPEEHLQKIFDPFFTTKETGSGLGLSSSYTIVKRHDGYMAVESELGVGTTFHIYLPSSEEEIVSEGKKEGESFEGRGRVLFMDDEKDIRLIASEMLKLSGYEVVTVEDGDGAVELYREAMESGRAFDVVIMDITVPGGVGGKEAIKKLLEIDPDAKALISSGYSTDPVMAEFKKHGFKGIVPKPFKPGELRKVVGKVIAAQFRPGH